LSEANSIGAAPVVRNDPRAAIARASQVTGVDFRFLLAQAKIESGLDPAAQAKTSSAAGLYQFTRSTWLETLDRHGADHGLGWAGAAIQNGGISDPGVRAQVLALRFDPEVSARMAAEFTSDNRDALAASLGREPDPGELYLAHFLGAAGAVRFLGALSADPGASAPALLPAAAAANRSIFYKRSGAARSLGEVMELVRDKVEAAMRESDVRPAMAQEVLGWGQSPVAMTGTGVAPQDKPLHRRGLPSMADTLASTFGLKGSPASENVRVAYGKLRAFGL
jgi:hypothetical protein